MTKTRTVKRRKSRSIGKKFIILLMACFLLYMVGNWVWDLWHISMNTREKLTSLHEQKQELLEEQAKLKEEIERLNNPSYIEQLAREQLGLVKPGEILIAPKEAE